MVKKIIISAIVVTIAVIAITNPPLKKLFAPQEGAPEEQVTPIPTPSPTASPSATPTPKPLTFSEMNALYGPCVSLPVLMYHHVQESETAKKNGNGNLTVYPDIFDKQLAYLQSHGYQSIGPSDLIAFFNEGKSLPKKGILLTFDDGYEDFNRLAAPILSKYSFKSTLFTPTGLLENPGYLSWQAVQSLAGSGVYIGNHTWSHKNMGAGLDTIKREIDTAARQLSEKGLDPLKVFAYPYGTISQRAINYLSESGFQLAFTTQPGRTLCKKQRLTLPRVRIGNGNLGAYGL